MASTRISERHGWADMRVHNGLILLKDTARRVYATAIDSMGEHRGEKVELLKLPDPPVIRRRVAAKRRT